MNGRHAYTHGHTTRCAACSVVWRCGAWPNRLRIATGAVLPALALLHCTDSRARQVTPPRDG